MTYATTAELKALTGTTLPTTTLQAILDDTDRQINVRLGLSEVSPPASDDKLKSACLSLGRIGLLLWGVPKNAETATISELREDAYAAVDSYILSSQAQRARWNIRKVN